MNQYSWVEYGDEYYHRWCALQLQDEFNEDYATPVDDSFTEAHPEICCPVCGEPMGAD